MYFFVIAFILHIFIVLSNNVVITVNLNDIASANDFNNYMQLDNTGNFRYFVCINGQDDIDIDIEHTLVNIQNENQLFI